MDAKPFRPTRALPAANNENLAQAKQNIHQRFKSTGSLRGQPALATSTTGLPQATTRRAVFADKSNTVRTNMSQDDSKMPHAKFQVARAKENSNPSHGAQKDAFLRPAQRPKGASLLPSAASGGYLQPLNAAGDSQAPSQGATKPLKRATTIVYNDNSRPATSGSATINSQKIEATDEGSTAAAAPFTRKPRHHQSQPALKSTQQKEQHIVSLLDADIKNLVNWEPLTAEKNTHEEDVAQTPYLDAVEELSPEKFPVLQSVRAEATLSVPGPDSELRSEPRALKTNYQEECVAPATDPDHSDHEDEDFYEVDQGYTTANLYPGGDAPLTDTAELPEGEPEPSITVTVMDAPRFSSQMLEEIEEAREHVERNRSSEEVEDELWDISMVAEYGDEIFQYMKEMEIALLPNPHYMDIQTEIQWSMRGVLMDWVIQVHGRFNLLPETLFLAVNFIDRFLTVKVVSLGKLQLVGATAIFLAAKYEEINCPSVQEIVYMVDGGYSVDEILKAERYMLSMLDFNLGFPGPMSFLRRISKADDYDLETRTLAKYFLEVTVMDERFVASPPSFLAAGAHCLSRLILEKGGWTLDHVHYSGYTFAQLQPLVNSVLECCAIADKHHQAVFEKYSDKRFKKCAIYVHGQIKSGFFLEPVKAAVSAANARYENFPYTLGSTTSAYEPSSYMRMPIPMQG
ncbi:cyclin-like protein [Truncatella angustata]|uniref:Cyclin-like protein n=1 Tax=Truncatella angustata TaxID=152316 RepID=A0A9P8UFA4_9PEZI|nr:cyclin-like protein [Truncatella angustata]KAH6648866.1 cyclin-like protein [Truncatella angustata]